MIRSTAPHARFGSPGRPRTPERPPSLRTAATASHRLTSEGDWAPFLSRRKTSESADRSAPGAFAIHHPATRRRQKRARATEVAQGFPDQGGHINRTASERKCAVPGIGSPAAGKSNIQVTSGMRQECAPRGPYEANTAPPVTKAGNPCRPPGRPFSEPRPSHSAAGPEAGLRPGELTAPQRSPGAAPTVGHGTNRAGTRRAAPAFVRCRHGGTSLGNPGYFRHGFPRAALVVRTVKVPAFPACSGEGQGPGIYMVVGSRSQGCA